MTPPDEPAVRPLDLDAIEADLDAIEAHLTQLDDQTDEIQTDAVQTDADHTDADQTIHGQPGDEGDDQLAGADPARA